MASCHPDQPGQNANADSAAPAPALTPGLAPVDASAMICPTGGLLMARRCANASGGPIRP